MFPTIHELGNGVGMHTYGLFILLAFCSAFLYVQLRAMRIGLHPDKLLPVYGAAAVGGLLGGRLLYELALNPMSLLTNPFKLFAPSGFAVYGGVIGGTIAVAAVAIPLGIRPWKLADIAAPSVLIGMGVGRIGCFFAGCCHGAIAPKPVNPVGLLPESFSGGQIWLSTNLPFLTTEFASNNGNVVRPSLHDIPLYPTQIWAAVMLLALAGLLAWAWEKKRFDGQIAALALLLEPFYRITVESFRADERGYAIAFEVSEAVAAWFPTGMSKAGAEIGAQVGITTSQGIGLASIAAGVFIWMLRRNAGVAEEIPVESGEDEDEDELDDILG